jgi:hypothetical protein
MVLSSVPGGMRTLQDPTLVRCKQLDSGRQAAAELACATLMRVSATRAVFLRSAQPQEVIARTAVLTATACGDSRQAPAVPKVALNETLIITITLVALEELIVSHQGQLV